MAKVIKHTSAEPPTKQELARQHCEEKGFQVLELKSKSITLQCPKQHAPFTRTYPTMYGWASGTHTVLCDACSTILRHEDTFTRCAAVGQRLVTPVGKFTRARTIEVECHCGHIRRTNLGNVEKCVNCVMCRENPSSDPTVQAKRLATNLARRGVDNPFADPSVQAKTRATNLERRGVEYSGADPSVQAKMRETNLERRGVDNPFADPAVQAKIRSIHLEKRGVENVGSDPTVQAKIRATNIVRRGVENPGADPAVQAKIRKTNLERRGVEYSGADPEVQGKRKATMLKRYGAMYSSHVPEILEKMILTRFKPVHNTLEDGRIVALQGYEYPALQWLLSESSFIDPTLGRRLVISDLVFGKAQVPKIMYDGHRYYTDMAVLNSNTIIEVKSPYTLRQDWDVNIAKFEASILAGYTLVLITWDKKSIVDFTILRPTDSTEALALAMDKIEAASHGTRQDLVQFSQCESFKHCQLPHAW